MSQIDTLVGGAGNVTTINLDNGVPQILLIGDGSTDLPISNIQLSVSGKTYISASVQALIQAYSKWLMQSLLGADVKVAQAIILANGFIPGKNCQIELTNAGATTPAIYAHSINKGNAPMSCGQSVVLDSGSQLFSGFEALFFDPANLDYVDVTFDDGHKDKFTSAELSVLFARGNQADASGLLGTMQAIDNSRGNISQVEIYASGGNITVLQAV